MTDDELMEKQKPMKPGSDELGIDGRITRPYGNCGEELKTVLWEYCPVARVKLRDVDALPDTERGAAGFGSTDKGAEA